MASPRARWHVNYLVVLALVLQVIGAFFFAKGFFPFNEPSEGYGQPLQSEDNRPSGKSFDRLVFVLIDALRTDFMFSDESKMNLTQKLVREGRALPFTAIAQSPTVTLPRLKAMTSGVNPQFIDAVWNIAESSDGRALLAKTDTWVRQIIHGPAIQKEDGPDAQKAARKRRSLFYGDDTWLRLFPQEWFEAHEGVSSFYVTDTEIVDHNVTRHLDDALSENPAIEWDVLILHYLGLDHVGHLGGAHSPLMGPKQTQLDHVVSRIYEKLSKDDAASGRKSLLVVGGDHGMTDAGNHGGSSEGEVSAGLLFASPSFRLPGLNSSDLIKPQRVQQLDVVPTLSVLFQGGIPPASIGVVIESVLDATFAPSSQVTSDVLQVGDLLRLNALQLARMLNSSIGEEAVRSFLPTTKDGQLDGELAQVLSKLDILETREFLRRSQGRLLEQFSGYQLSTMASGLFMLVLVAAYFFFNSSHRSPALPGKSVIFVQLATLAQLASLLSTSFIEEEHEAWFFLGSTSLLVMAIWPNSHHSALTTSARQRCSYLSGSAFVRILRGWSPNGQKAKPDCSLSHLLQSVPWSLHALDFMGFIILWIRWRPHRYRGAWNTVSATALVVASFLTMVPADHTAFNWLRTKLGDASRHHHFRLIYLLLFISLGVSAMIPSRSQRNLNLRLVYLVFLRSLTRSSNYIPLWLSFYAPELFKSSPFAWPEHCFLDRLRLKHQHPSHGKVVAVETDDRKEALISAWVQLMFAKCTFFAFGGSNSLATVDLSNSYNGISSYSLPIVTLLTFLSNFAGPICNSLGFMMTTDQQGDTNAAEIRTQSRLVRFHLSAYYCLQLFVICGIATSFSEHLFVYTVFSPAVLYGFVWTFFFHYSTMMVDLFFL